MEPIEQHGAFLLIPTDIYEANVIILRAGAECSVGRGNLRFKDRRVEAVQVKIQVGIDCVQISNPATTHALCIERKGQDVVEELQPTECTTMYSGDRLYLLQGMYCFVLVHNTNTAGYTPLSPSHHIESMFPKLVQGDQALVRTLLLCNQRFPGHLLPDELLLHVISYLHLHFSCAHLQPLPVFPAHLLLGNNVLDVPGLPPNTSVNLKLDVHGRVGLFVYHPRPMPNIHIQLFHDPSGHRVLHRRLENIPTDYTSYGYTFFLKKRVLEAICNSTGFFLLQVTYHGTPSPTLRLLLSAAVTFTDAYADMALSKTWTAPLERAKLHLQLRDAAPGAAPGARSPGVLATLAAIAREEGVRGWWRGNAMNIARYAPTQCLNGLIRHWSKQLRTHAETISCWPRRPGFKRFAVHVTMGSVAGALSLLLVYPLDTYRTLLGLGCPLDDPLRLQWSVMYQGVVSSIWGVATYRTCYFFFYDLIRGLGMPHSSMARYLLCYLATASAEALSYPLDTVRRRLMVQAFYGRPTSAAECCRRIVRQEGLLALWKGLRCSLLKGVCGIVAIEVSKRWRRLTKAPRKVQHMLLRVLGNCLIVLGLVCLKV